MPLTDLAIRQAKSLEKPYHLADGDALYQCRSIGHAKNKTPQGFTRQTQSPAPDL